MRGSCPKRRKSPPCSSHREQVQGEVQLTFALREVAEQRETKPQYAPCSHLLRGVCGTLRNPNELLGDGLRLAVLPTDHAVDPDAVKRVEQAIQVGEAFRDFAGTGVGLNGRSTRVAGNSNQGSPKGKLQLQFAPRPEFVVGQCVKRCQSTRDVTDRFPVCRLSRSLLASEAAAQNGIDRSGAPPLTK